MISNQLRLLVGQLNRILRAVLGVEPHVQIPRLISVDLAKLLRPVHKRPHGSLPSAFEVRKLSQTETREFVSNFKLGQEQLACEFVSLLFGVLRHIRSVEYQVAQLNARGFDVAGRPGMWS